MEKLDRIGTSLACSIVQLFECRPQSMSLFVCSDTIIQRGLESRLCKLLLKPPIELLQGI